MTRTKRHCEHSVNQWMQFSPLLGILLLMLAMFASCTEDESYAIIDPLPLPTDVSSIEVRLSHESVTRPEDLTKTVSLTAILRNLNGVEVPDHSVQFEMNSEIAWFTHVDDKSNEHGQAGATIYIEVPYGESEIVIKVSTGQVSNTVIIKVYGQPRPVNIAFTDVSPLQIETGYRQEKLIPVAAQVFDKRGEGIPGLNIAFSTLSGQAEFGGISTTDEHGAAMSMLRVTGDYFSELKLLASLVANQIDETQGFDNGLLADTLMANITLESEIGLHFLTSDTTIPLYSGTDRIPVRISITDEANRPIQNEVISFKADNAIIVAPGTAATGSDGTAEILILLNSNPGAARLEATYEPLGLKDEMMIVISDDDDLTATLEFTDPGSVIWTQTHNSSRVAVRYQDGGPGIGIPVRLICRLGNSIDQVTETNEEGFATLPYSPEVGGSEHLTVEANGEAIPGAELSFRVYEDPVRLMGSLEPAPEDLRYTEINLDFQLLDTLDQPVPRERVQFLTNIVSTNHAQTLTDANGRGSVLIRRGDQAGTGTLTALWRDRRMDWEVVFDTYPFDHFTVSLPDTLEMGETGLIEIFLWNMNDNPCLQPMTLELETIGGDRGVSFEPGSVTNENGRCEFSVRGEHASGTQFWLILRPVPNIPGGLTVRVLLGPIMVVPDEPYSIDLTVLHEYVGESEQSWTIEALARVYDRYRNPILSGTPVYMSINQQDEDTVIIGNMSQRDFGIAGGAFWSFTYQSDQTFDPFTLHARVETAFGDVTASREHVYPLQEGYLELNVDPANFMFDEQHDECEIRCWVNLVDGHQVPINNAPILFRQNRGRLFWLNRETEQMVPFFPDPARAYTSRVDQQHFEEGGEATVYFKATYEEIIDWWWPWPELTIQVNASVEDYPDVTADPAFIFLTTRQ